MRRAESERARPERARPERARPERARPEQELHFVSVVPRNNSCRT